MYYLQVEGMCHLLVFRMHRLQLCVMCPLQSTSSSVYASLSPWKEPPLSPSLFINSVNGPWASAIYLQKTIQSLSEPSCFPLWRGNVRGKKHEKKTFCFRGFLFPCVGDFCFVVSRADLSGAVKSLMIYFKSLRLPSWLQRPQHE